MDAQNEILQRLVRVETKLDNILEYPKIGQDAFAIANEASQSSRAAHKRLDRIDRIIFWASTTIIGAMIVAIIAFIVAGGMAK
jgi:hypothetical protein